MTIYCMIHIPLAKTSKYSVATKANRTKLQSPMMLDLGGVLAKTTSLQRSQRPISKVTRTLLEGLYESQTRSIR